MSPFSVSLEFFASFMENTHVGSYETFATFFCTTQVDMGLMAFGDSTWEQLIMLVFFLIDFIFHDFWKHF